MFPAKCNRISYKTDKFLENGIFSGPEQKSLSDILSLPDFAAAVVVTILEEESQADSLMGTLGVFQLFRVSFSGHWMSARFDVVPRGVADPRMMQWIDRIYMVGIPKEKYESFDEPDRAAEISFPLVV